MKPFIYAILFATFLTVSAKAQTRISSNHIDFQILGKDSVSMPLNSNYQLTEDSSAQIIRHGHVDTHKGVFTGKFRDLSKDNPAVIINEGSYNKDGLKDGGFTTHYLNGNLQANGAFKDDKYIGKWNFYYEDGSPELTFEVIDGTINITDAWDNNKVKIVDKGNGRYLADDYNGLGWEGKLVNGRPDGVWKFINTNIPGADAVVTEHFKKGRFISGKSPFSEYSDSSHLILVSNKKLSLTNAELYPSMLIRYNANSAETTSHSPSFVNARYPGGTDSFIERIQNGVAYYLSTLNLISYNSEVVIHGVVSEKGELGSFSYGNASSPELCRGLIRCLERLPLLWPATIDKKPVPQKFTITFTFYNGAYKFSYKLLPLNQ